MTLDRKQHHVFILHNSCLLAFCFSFVSCEHHSDHIMNDVPDMMGGRLTEDLLPSLDFTSVEDRSFDQGRIDQEIIDASPTPESSDAIVSPSILDTTEMYLNLSINDAELRGSYTWLDEQRLLLDAEATVRWSIDSNIIPLEAIITIMIKGQIWRVEDGVVSIRLNEEEKRWHVWGNGLYDFHPLRTPYDQWQLEHLSNGNDREHLFGASAAPPKLSWVINSPLNELTLKADAGGLIISDLMIRGVDAPPQVPPTLDEDNVGDLERMVISYQTCSIEPQCDDGAALQRIINESPEGPLEIELPSQEYKAYTPVVIRRAQTTIKGMGERPIWHWSPHNNSGQSWPFQFRGDGLHSSALIISEAINTGQRQIRVEGEIAHTVNWVQLNANDFGDIPPVCIGGRDIERLQRHQKQLFRVLDITIESGTSLLTLDRAINLDIPLEAIPKLSPVHLLTEIKLEHLHLQANCIESLGGGFQQARCTNLEVLDDGGVLGLFTENLILNDLSASSFGKFTYEIRESLESVVSNSRMKYPSAYGSGGQGYGVHLIGASRSVISELQVENARHGVVVDFGSSDSQIIGGVFLSMNQALIDIHGEASRDTLIRGAMLSESSLGIIIGGGGRTVHCNDGPRHHVQLSHISHCGIGISMSDYTELGFIHSNSFIANGSHLAAVFGASSMFAERNRFVNAQLKPFSLSHEDTTKITLKRNEISGHCTPEEATILLVGALAPTFEDNLWCVDP